MLATIISKPFFSKDWIFETKWNGFGAIAYVRDGFMLQSRNDKELKYAFPELEELRLLAESVVVDGEIVVMKQGKVDFHALQERGYLVSGGDIERLQHRSPATCVAFDILEKDGKPVANFSLTERKKILRESVKKVAHNH